MAGWLFSLPGHLAGQAVDPARIVNRRLIPAIYQGKERLCRQINPLIIKLYKGWHSSCTLLPQDKRIFCIRGKGYAQYYKGQKRALCPQEGGRRRVMAGIYAVQRVIVGGTIGIGLSSDSNSRRGPPD